MKNCSYWPFVSLILRERKLNKIKKNNTPDENINNYFYNKWMAICMYVKIT